MELYKKYRPTKIDELFGNKETVKKLKGFIKNPAHAILLSGPTGTGKTTTARIIANSLGCSKMDYKEINAADTRGVDTIREIIKQAHYLPMEGYVKMWVIDEAHQLSSDAQNAFLKILEDTPGHVYFVLATTEPEKLKPTVRGRCSQFHFEPLDVNDCIDMLEAIVEAEGDALEDKIYDQIVDSSNGLPREAIQILDQVLQTEERGRLKIAEKFDNQRRKSIDLCRALIGQKSVNIRSILNDLKNENPESIRRHVLSYATSVALSSDGQKADRASLIIGEFWEPFYNVGFAGVAYAARSVLTQLNEI